MAGLVPAIHVLTHRPKQDVDARHKAGHDNTEIFADTPLAARQAVTAPVKPIMNLVRRTHAGYLLIASLNSRTKTGEKVMRRFLSAVAVVVSLASVAIAGPKEDALQVLEKWSKAFGESNVDEIVNLYAPDALFLGTQSKTVVVKPEGVRKYFENALLSNKPRSATLSSYETSVLSDNAVVVTGLDATAGVRDGKPYSNPGRVTFVIAKQGADWKIVHFHRSAIPN